MSLSYLFWKGWPSHINVGPTLGQYVKGHRHIKIGITCHPERRFKEHQHSGPWDRMVVLYETNSWNHAKEMELKMIAYLNKCGKEFSLHNKSCGGEGNPSTQDGCVYYSYILLTK